MNPSERFSPNEKVIGKLQREVRLAAQAYFRAANAHNEAILEAKVRGWKTDADGHQSLHSAAQLERYELQRYAHLVQALKDAVLPAPKPAKPRNRRPRKVTVRPLSPRQRQILKLIAEGLSSREISARLNISFKTATTHRYQIMRKLGIHDVVTLVRYALQNKLIES